MKKIIKYISVFAIILLSSCSDNEKNLNTVQVTDVYSITDINGVDAVQSITIYRAQPLVVEYINSTSIKSYETTGYVDASDDLTYSMSFNKIIVTSQESGPDLVEELAYVIDADVLLGTGTLTVTNSDLSVEVYTISISKANRYI